MRKDPGTSDPGVAGTTIAVTIGTGIATTMTVAAIMAARGTKAGGVMPGAEAEVAAAAAAATPATVEVEEAAVGDTIIGEATAEAAVASKIGCKTAVGAATTIALTEEVAVAAAAAAAAVVATTIAIAAMPAAAVVVVVASKTGCRITATGAAMTIVPTGAHETIAIETAAMIAVGWAATTEIGAVARAAAIARAAELINNGIFGLATATPKKIVAVAMSGQLANRCPSTGITRLPVVATISTSSSSRRVEHPAEAR